MEMTSTFYVEVVVFFRFFRVSQLFKTLIEVNSGIESSGKSITTFKNTENNTTQHNKTNNHFSVLTTISYSIPCNEP